MKFPHVPESEHGTHPDSCEALLIERAAQTLFARVLHTGAKQSVDGRSTIYREWFRPNATHYGTDVEAGAEVDYVADLEDLSPIRMQCGRFDFVMCCSTLEHVARPWVAAKEVAQVVKPGGLIFVQTHQTFPLHGYPHDYWRFSTHALQVLFSEESGWKTLRACYQYPAVIVPESGPIRRDNWDACAASFLNVYCVAERLDV